MAAAIVPSSKTGLHWEISWVDQTQEEFDREGARAQAIQLVPACPSTSLGLTPSVSPMCERQYSVSELAKMWNRSSDTITRMFENEPGVQVWVRPGRTSKRRFRTFRIPQSVAERVYLRMGLR